MSVMSRQIPVTVDRRASRTVCFRGVSRPGIYGENGKNSSILIRTILVFSFIMHWKLITQWFKCAFDCVCLDLSISEMKKSSENSEFIHRHHSATWRLKPKFACSQCSVIHDTRGNMTQEESRKERWKIISAAFFYEPIPLSGMKRFWLISDVLSFRGISVGLASTTS